MTQHASLDIEDHAQLAGYLCRRGDLDRAYDVSAITLTGGVSNKTVLVTLLSGEQWVIKQALPKLRVQADWFSDPSRIHREALALRWMGQLLPTGASPGLILEDDSNHILAMQAVPQPHENWKTVLLGGKVHEDHILQFASLLADLHLASAARQTELAAEFDDRTFFETLRLEPYFAYTSQRVPEAGPFMQDLIERTRANRHALVHGDYSPKNVLVQAGRLVLLDYEVMHWGDPAFDLGFGMTHLLSKAHHVVSHRAAFAQAAHLFWRTYAMRAASHFGDLEARSVQCTLGCLLARVDGRSPLEYLTNAARDRQRAAVLAIMNQLPLSMDQLIERFVRDLHNEGSGH